MISLEVFNTKVEKTDGCWNWMGCKDQGGYGQITRDRIGYKAHRLSYELHIGPIPDGLWVLHSCYNPWCANPKHLFLGTRQDNIDDKVRKGRQSRGEKAGPAKLSTANVLEIKALLLSDVHQQKIANMFGVSDGHISRINTGKKWGHV